MLKWSYWFGPNPYLLETDYFESLDIDEMADIMETISPRIARECWGVGYLDNDFEWDPSGKMG